MDKSTFLNNLGDLEQYLFNYSVEINYTNFVIAIILSTFLAFFIKLTYIRCSNSLNDKNHFADIFIPLATAIDALIDENLPGPLLTRIEKLLSKFTLCFFVRFNMLNTNCSLLIF